jgi:hypothetical protein
MLTLCPRSQLMFAARVCAQSEVKYCVPSGGTGFDLVVLAMQQCISRDQDAVGDSENGHGAEPGDM